MNRRDFLKTSAAVAAATAVLGKKAFGQANPTYTRNVHFVYGIGDNAKLDNTDKAIKSALLGVTGGVTCLCPFLLNSLNPMENSNFSNMINFVQNNGITVTPAVGYPASGNTLNNPANQAIATGYLPLGKHIRLENLSGFYQNPNGEADIKGFITYCINAGFTNIMLNPWPLDSSGKMMPIGADMLGYIDATFQSVNPNTWTINSNDVTGIHNADPTMQILVNYESPGPQKTIAGMSISNQINKVFKVTVADIQNNYPISDHLHWAPPFTQSYDPLDPATLTWASYIQPTLSSFQG